MGASTKFDFDCDTMISKMFRIYLVLCFFISICLSCRLLVPSELLNGCIFDPMIVSVSHAGFSISRDNCNSEIAKHVFAEQPLVYYGRARSDRTYTVMMIDPDYPHHQNGQFYLHWLVTNIPGEWLRQGLTYDIGEYIVGYTAPDPPVFSGEHRYMVFAYEQLEHEIEVPQPDSRAKFDPISWMESFGGEDVIRGPVASIGFKSEF
ncbi:protein RICE FLOWERING LOCUS T 1-like [Contarinia nasturtii]|uniref:protein RICE FLOWERING LOCUS T 1-like n=1 Tax=Contarinia nasturtii TaxID=265458 RepID=UPI0012D3AC6D|nr:protein RICE FLOWERING LOCUS T 1-like [Contarinia nasturtii]